MAERRRYMRPVLGNRVAGQDHRAQDERPPNRPAADEPGNDGPVAAPAPGRWRLEMTACLIDRSGNLRVLHVHSLPSLRTIAT
jgi:hypothetical protein